MAPLYIGETAPNDLRGKLVSLKEAAIVLGIVAGYTTGAIFGSGDNAAWQPVRTRVTHAHNWTRAHAHTHAHGTARVRTHTSKENERGWRGAALGMLFARCVELGWRVGSVQVYGCALPFAALMFAGVQVTLTPKLRLGFLGARALLLPIACTHPMACTHAQSARCGQCPVGCLSRAPHSAPWRLRHAGDAGSDASCRHDG